MVMETYCKGAYGSGGGGGGGGGGSGGGWGGGLHARAALSCLRVLCAGAGGEPWVAARVASEPGLLDAVREVR